jgi:hypothetical protein
MRVAIPPLGLAALAILSLEFLTAGPAAAQEVRVTVVAILATTDKNAPVEKELASIAAVVKQTYPDLVGFRRGTMTTKPVAIGKDDTFPLVDDETAMVSILQGMDKKEMIRVKVKPPLLNEITMNCCCSKFVPFVTPYETRGKKERLIIAVMVNPCPGQ